MGRSTTTFISFDGAYLMTERRIAGSGQTSEIAFSHLLGHSQWRPLNEQYFRPKKNEAYGTLLVVVFSSPNSSILLEPENRSRDN